MTVCVKTRIRTFFKTVSMQDNTKRFENLKGKIFSFIKPR